MPAGKILYDEQSARHFKSRVFVVLSLFFFFIVAARFGYIQIVKGRDFEDLSKENMMRVRIMKAPRGVIYDRRGRVLARNRPSYAVSLLYHKMGDRENLIRALLRIEDEDGRQVFDVRSLSRQIDLARLRRFEPVKLADDVGIDVVTVVEEHIIDLPGIIVENEARREYPNGTLACHALGYLGEIPEARFDSLKALGYFYGARMGVFGLEKQYERPFLKGRDGQEYVMFDAFGRELERMPDMPVIPFVKGADITLALDLDLQKAAEAAFPDTLAGAAVAVDPRNGEVLAMLSSPPFNPNLFELSSEKRTRSWRRLVLDPTKPLNNRAATGLYPPGSTFKLVTAGAGLNEHLVELKDRFKPCLGAFRYGRRNYRCWRRQGHGAVTMVNAVKYSCDVYFYQAGLKTGIDLINQYARMFGFGEITGIDLPDEQAGELLDEEIYNRKFEDKGWVWTKGQILNASIGQAQVVTPLQLACYTAALGNGHTLFRPRLLMKARVAGQEAEPFPAETLGVITLADSTRQMVRDALRAVLAPGGTGGRASVKDIDIGGKTGTAENPQGEDHALFVAVGPLDDPQIAVAVVVENAGHGGTVAAPIAGKILNAYFNPE
jgi:penicillin-binding protein 2